MDTVLTGDSSLRRVLRWVALLGLCVTMVVMLGKFLASPTGPLPIDFAAYWSGGRLTLDGENPYDPVRVHELQRSIGLNHSHAILVYQPPFALTLLLPFGALPVRTGYGLLCLVDLAIVLGVSDQLWRVYGGSAERRWVAWLVGLVFAPTVVLIGAGQVSAFSLLGLGLFLAAVRSDRPALAGLGAALVAMKPHLNYLFGVVLFLEATRSHFTRRAVLVGLAIGVVTSLIPVLFNPHVWSQHVATVTGSGSDQHLGIADWKNPLLGSYIRAWVPGQPMWVQAVPCFLGLLLIGPYWWRSQPWDWTAELPRLTLVSLLTAMYGAWSFDLVLLLVPLLAALARSLGRSTPLWRSGRPGLALVVLLLGTGAMYAAVALKAEQHSYVWVTPLVFGVVWALVPRLSFSPREST